jgi:hypothetical protein
MGHLDLADIGTIAGHHRAAWVGDHENLPRKRPARASRAADPATPELFDFAERPTKRMSDYLSTTPADGITAHCSPTEIRHFR